MYRRGIKMIEQTTTSFVSERAGQIQASITMAITALSNKLKKEGKPVIGMSAGEPDFDSGHSVSALRNESTTISR